MHTKWKEIVLIGGKRIRTALELVNFTCDMLKYRASVREIENVEWRGSSRVAYVYRLFNCHENRPPLSFESYMSCNRHAFINVVSALSTSATY